MATSLLLPESYLDTSTCLLEEPPAKPFPLQETEQDWMTLVATSQWNTSDLLSAFSRDGLSGKTSQAFCQSTQEGRLEPSSGRWANSGMGSPTEFLTLKTSESHSAAVACSLSDVLETGDVPQRLYLSAKACAGILRRAEKRGRQLPHLLQTALERVAQTITKHKQGI
jgi:hypothetical protein